MLVARAVTASLEKIVCLQNVRISLRCNYCLYSLYLFRNVVRIFVWRMLLIYSIPRLVLRPCVGVRSAKSKIVLKTAATGSVTKTFAHLFASDKLSLCRKVKSEQIRHA